MVQPEPALSCNKNKRAHEKPKAVLFSPALPAANMLHLGLSPEAPLSHPQALGMGNPGSRCLSYSFLKGLAEATCRKSSGHTLESKSNCASNGEFMPVFLEIQHPFLLFFFSVILL